MQFICLNLPAILESRALELLDDDAFERLDRYYTNSNPVFRRRRLIPLTDYPTSSQVETEYQQEPLTYEELISAEENTRLEMKSRPRRHSSGDKRAERTERKSETRRLDSTTSTTSESDNDSEVGDKLCLQDFDIEEERTTIHLLQYLVVCV